MLLRRSQILGNIIQERNKCLTHEVWDHTGSLKLAYDLVQVLCVIGFFFLTFVNSCGQVSCNTVFGPDQCVVISSFIAIMILIMMIIL